MDKRDVTLPVQTSKTSKTCLLCSSRILFVFEYIKFEIYLDALAWISFAKFETKFINPIGRQCFDFVRPKS